MNSCFVYTFIAIFIAGCATEHRYTPYSSLSAPPAQYPVIEEKPGSDGGEATENLIKEVDSGIERSSLQDEEKVYRESRGGEPTIPMEINASVRMWLEYYSKKDRARFQRFLDNGEPFRPMIEKVLQENGIPQELYYLALIESGFQLRARSHASAVGVWQFIKPTGKRYGLRIDNSVDERQDPVRATIAASAYLRDLHTVFQTWYLAMAAYNAGEMRILNGIMRSKTRDFWELAAQKALPRETLHYVPKFIAAAIIGHHPERFGFRKGNSEDTFPDLERQAVPAGIRLDELAQVSGVPLSEIKKYNPHLRKNVIPPGHGQYDIWVREEHREKLADNAVALGKLRQQAADLAKDLGQRDSASTTTQASSVHRVRRGENLQLIARKYGTSIAQLKRLNNLKSGRILAGQKLKVSGRNASKAKLFQKKFAESHYRVRSGDNLTSVAKRFGLSTKTLKRLNKLHRDKLYIGELLNVTPTTM